MNTVTHPIPPVFDSASRILILGSFPSVKSREGHFFYHHPQNRFWKTLAGILAVPVPGSIDEKKEFLLLPPYCPLGRDRILFDRRFQRQLHPRCRAQRSLPDPVHSRHPGDLLQRKDILELLQKIPGIRNRHPGSLPAIHKSGECGVDAGEIGGRLGYYY